QGIAPPVAGKGLALSTGKTGCSWYQRDSKPKASTVLARNAGSRVYAGSGTTMPTAISFLRVGERFSARGGPTVAQRRAPLNHGSASAWVTRVQAYPYAAHGPLVVLGRNN